jgi:hypothetical protein
MLSNSSKMSEPNSIAFDPLGLQAEPKIRELRILVAIANDDTGYWWEKTKRIPSLAFDDASHRDIWQAFTTAKSWRIEDRPSGYVLPLLNHSLLMKAMSTVQLDVKWLLLRWAETLDPSQWGELAGLYPQDQSENDDPSQRFSDLVFDLSNPPPPVSPRFFIQEKPVATPGNLAVIIAQAKSGKTALVGAFIAAFLAALNDTTSECDLLGLSASHPGQCALLHFDTEQSPEDHDAVIRRSIRRARVHDCAQVRSVRLTTIPIADRFSVIKSFVNFHAKTSGVQAIIIDGIADLVFDVNDLRECSTMVADLHALAINSACSIICVIHDNEGKDTNGDGRGHLGKQLMRKAESNLRLKKRDDATVVFSEKMRRAPIFEKDGTCFAWNDAAGMHVTTARLEPHAKGYGRPKEHSFASFAEIIPTDPEKGLGLNALWRAACDVRPVSKGVFSELINEAKAVGLVGLNNSIPGKPRHFRIQK